MTNKDAQDRTRAAMYAGMVAYSKEHRRLRRPKDTSRIDARCFLIGARAFIEAMKDEDVELIEDDADASDPTNPADRMYENEVIK
jgi:hypothetical protein